MPDPVRLVVHRAAEGRVCGGARRVEAAVDVLPHGPQSVYVRVQEEEERVSRRGSRDGDRPGEAHVRRPVRLNLHRQEVLVEAPLGFAEFQRRLLVEHRPPAARGPLRRGGVKVPTTGDSGHVVRDPKPERVGGAKADGRPRGRLRAGGEGRGLRLAHEVAREELGRGLVEAPVVERDRRVYVLQLPLEVEQVRAVPREEARVAVRLVERGLIAVHVAEVAELAQPAVVERGQRRDEAVALVVCQGLDVLAHANHQLGDGEYAAPGRLDDFD